MAIPTNHHEQWIYGTPQERMLIVAIMTMIAISPFVMWWFHS